MYPSEIGFFNRLNGLLLTVHVVDWMKALVIDHGSKNEDPGARISGTGTEGGGDVFRRKGVEYIIRGVLSHEVGCPL